MASGDDGEEDGFEDDDDGFVVEDDGEELAIVARPWSAASGRDRVAGKHLLRPSTAGPAHHRPLGTIPARRPASAMGSKRTGKERPESAASAAESEASAASTQIAESRPTSALSLRPGSTLAAESRHMSALKLRPGSAQAQSESPGTRPSTAEVRRDVIGSSQLRQRPASALPAQCTRAGASHGSGQNEPIREGSFAQPRKLLWQWPMLSEMRMSAFDGDPDARDKDDLQQQTEEILGSVGAPP